jgi:tetratricopeptide (TPR) repeat protein
MKTFVTATLLLCLAIVAAVIHANLKHDAPASLTEAAAPAINSSAIRQLNARSKTNPSVNPRRSAFLAAATRQPGAPPADSVAAALRETVGQLVSRTTTFQQREAVWHQLNDLEHLDPVIDALKQGATNNPDSPEYQAALGKANLQKAGIVSREGGSMNELGILGMTADQNFDAALKIDPSNWDAQFFKAVAMSYWPAEVNKGDEVIQRLSGLIAQQDSQSPQPEFALPYVALGQQYQKLGQNDNALQAWQAGAAKFPNDSTLQQKLASAPAAH